MEKDQQNPWSQEEKKTRKRKECDIPDEQRCQRADRKKNWRCKNARENHIYCKHHMNLQARNYMVRKGKKKPIEDKETNGMKEIDNTGAVAISRREENNNSRIRNPQISKETRVPSEISDVDQDILPTLLMEAWNGELTPAERISLRGLLPEGDRDDAAVMSLFCGGSSRFGIDRAGNWCKSVCEGKENPDAVMEREWELKISQSQYLKDLKEYHEDFIAKAEWYKRLWSNVCKRDGEMFTEILEKCKPRPTKRRK